MPSTVRYRETGAIARSSRTGAVTVESPTGGRMDIVTPPSAPGFSPVDLIYASLSSCLVISTRMAAARMGLSDRLTAVTVEVTGEKAEDGPSRIARFAAVFEIDGDLSDSEREALMHAAEGEICTISNTLQGQPSVAAELKR